MITIRKEKRIDERTTYQGVSTRDREMDDSEVCALCHVHER